MRRFIFLFTILVLLGFPTLSYLSASAQAGSKAKISSSVSFIEDTNGNQINNLNTISYTNPALEVDLLYSYGQIDNVKDQENLQASITKIVPITDIFNWGITNSFEYDYASELDRRISISPHLRLTPPSHTSLKTLFFTGLDYSVYKYREQHHFDKYNLYTGSKLTYRLTPYLTACEKIDYYPEIDDLNQYRVQSTTTISIPISSQEAISFEMKYKYNYSTVGTKRKGLYAGISAAF